MVLRFDRVAFGLLALVLITFSVQQQARAHEAVMLTEQEILAQIIGNTASGVLQQSTDGLNTTNRTEPFEGVRMMVRMMAPIRGNGPSLAQRCASIMTTLEMLVAG